MTEPAQSPKTLHHPITVGVVAHPRSQFYTLWPTTAGRRVEKIRYTIPHERHAIELDVYAGALAGLVVAEVEFGSAEEAAEFEGPEWFGVDVTSEKAFKNQQLATNGLPAGLIQREYPT